MFNYCVKTKIVFFFVLCLFAEEIRASPPDSISMEIKGKEVIITPSKKETDIGTTGGKIVISPDNVSKLPSMLGNTDLLKLLELTPGVQNSGDGNTNIYIRGGDTGQNLLLYNQISLYTPGHILGLFPLFNSDHVSTLTLSKSGIQAKYGGRLSSVINVESKKTLPDTISITGNAGLLASQATLAIPLGKKSGLYLSGRKTYLNLFLQPLLDASVNRNSKSRIEDSGYDFYDTNITWIGEFSENSRITVDAFLGSDNLQIAEKELYLNGTMDWTNRSLALQWDTKIRKQTLSQQIYISSYNNKLDVKQAEMGLHLSSSIRDKGYRNNYSFSIARTSMDIGMQYIFHEITPQIYNMTNVNQPYYTETVSTQKAHDGALYVQSSIPVGSQIKTELGLRYNIFYHNKLFHSIDPRMTLRYWLTDQTSLRLSYDRQHQYMNLLSPSSIGIPTDFWLAVSGDIPPQSSHEFSFGYTQSFPKANLDASAEIYYRNMDNLTEYSKNFLKGQSDSYFSDILLGSGRAYGIEIMLKKNYRKFAGWISYALARSERNFDGINDGRTFPARFDRRHDLSVVGTYTFSEEWDMSAVYAFATGCAYTLPSSWYLINNTPVKEYGNYNGARMPNYNRADFSVNYWFRKERNGLNFSVQNLFMVNNPIYVFLSVATDKKTGILTVKVKQKTLYKIVPSISWRFKF